MCACTSLYILAFEKGKNAEAVMIGLIKLVHTWPLSAALWKALLKEMGAGEMA